MIALVLWFGSFGIIYSEKPDWDSCQDAMIVLAAIHVEATCHLIEGDE